MRILLTLALSFLAGLIAMLFILPGKAGLFLAAGAAFLGLLLALLGRKRCLRPVLVCFGLAVGLVWAGGYQMLRVEPLLALGETEETLTVEATEYGQISDYGTGFTGKTALNGRTVWVYVSLEDSLEIKPGDQVAGTFYLRDSAASGSYFYYSEGVFLRAYSDEKCEIAYCDSIPLRYGPKVIARRLEEVLLKAFPDDTMGYAVGLTTGNRSYLSDGEVYDLKISGCYHALALSGMHLTVLIAMLRMFIGKKRRWGALLYLPLCGVFTVITGMTPSMVRAFIMVCFVYLAPLLHREDDGLTSLSAAALVLMMQMPWAIASWGLQLSFTATLGIILFQEKLLGYLQKKLKAERPKGNKHSIKYDVLSSLAMTFSALFFTVPLQMVYFGYVSIVAPITNLLTSLAVSICFCGSLLTSLVGLIFLPLGKILGWLLAWLFRYVKLVMALFADIPFAALYTDVPYALMWVILAYGVILLLMIWPESRKVIPLCCVGSALAVLLMMTTLDSAGFTFAALDVGQGQCLVFRSYGGTVMIDCGGSRSGQIAADYLGSMGESDVDLLIVTHYDNDHVGGIGDLMERKTVRGIMLPDVESDKKQEILTLAEAYHTDVYFCRRDQEVFFGGGEIQVFAPQSVGNSNESGLSALVAVDGMEILVTGDMETGTELLLLKNHQLPDIDVLVAGHHGARTSTSEILLTETKPETVVISVGENSYGHPHQETLERILNSGAEFRRTDWEGHIIMEGA